MRLLLTCALLLIVATPAALAQTAAPSYTLAVTTPSAALDPGAAAEVKLQVERHCPNPASVLDPQDVDVTLMGDLSNWTIAGPLQAHMEQQVCATQPIQAATVAYTLTASEGVRRGHVHAFFFRVSPTPSGVSALAQPADVGQTFGLAVTEAPPAPVVEEEPERESPGLGLVGALLALGIVAVARAVRRR